MEKIKEELIKNLEFNVEQHPKSKGVDSHILSVRPHNAATLFSEEMDIKITVGFYREFEKNRELAFKLFELALGI